MDSLEDGSSVLPSSPVVQQHAHFNDDTTDKEVEVEETQPLVVSRSASLPEEVKEMHPNVASEPEGAPVAQHGRPKTTRAQSEDVTAMAPPKTTKRGRGRPPKGIATTTISESTSRGLENEIDDQIAGEVAAQILHEAAMGNGHDEDSGEKELTDIELEKKKGRGRPKGSTAASKLALEAGFEDADGDEEITKETRHGRAKRSPRQSLSGGNVPFNTSDEVTQTPNRVRGRQSKKRDVAELSSDDVDSSDQDTFVPAVKRPGRPFTKRSFNEPSSDDDEEDVEDQETSQPPAKRRGRPSRRPAEADEFTPSTNGSNGIPKRGRPSKNSSPPTKAEEPKTRGRPRKATNGIATKSSVNGSAKRATRTSTANLNSKVALWNAQNWDLRGFSINMRKFIGPDGEEKSLVEGTFGMVLGEADAEADGVRAELEVNASKEAVTLKFRGELI